MTHQQEEKKTTGNLNAVFTTILGMALLAWALIAGIEHGRDSGTGFLVFMGILCIVLGIYFQGKPKRGH